MSSKSDSNADPFAEWAEYHLIIFGLDSSERAMKMVLSWRNILLPLGYEFKELMHATEWVAGNTPPKFLNQHLPRLIERLQQQRAVALKTRDQKVRDMTEAPCQYCDNTGYVSVPYLKDVDGGVWRPRLSASGRAYKKEGVVFCACMKGENIRVGSSRGVGLAEYEMMNPKWQQQFLAEKNEQRALREARKAAEQPGAEEIDARGIVRRLAGELGMEEE